MTDEFEETWDALVENGTSRRNKEPTFLFWQSLTPAQQHQAFVRITKKSQEGGFLQYDPIRAIKENIRKHQFVGPTDYNGKASIDSLMKTTRLVVAKFGKGSGIYTLVDAEAFRMDVIRGFNFDYNQYKQLKQQTNGKSDI